MANQPNQKPALTVGRIVRRFFPILAWLPQYERGWLRADFVAALTVWAVAVPIAMAYAGIAGAPPVVGLYSAILPLVAYAVFGTSRTVNVGPDSATALISFTAISALGVADPSQFLALTAALALLVGGMFLLFGLFRFGWVANFISTPVMRGFVQGLTWVTIIGQIPKLLSIKADRGSFFVKAWQIGLQAKETNLPTLAVGLSSLALLFAIKHWLPRWPAGLTAVALATLTVSLFGLKSYGIDIVGAADSGLPSFQVPNVEVEQLLLLLPGALAVVLIGFAESLGSARAAGRVSGEKINPNQELIALGAANIGSGINGGFVAVGSLSKTSIALEAGAKSQVASLMQAALVLLTLVFIVPAFANLPYATLAAIVIHSMLRLVDFGYLRRLYRISVGEFCVAVTALLGVMTLGVLPGIGLGVGLAALMLTYRSSFPGAAVLGKLPNEEIWRDVTRRRDAKTIPGLLIVRLEASPFFANAAHFDRKLRSLVSAAGPPVATILIDAENINDIDSTAIEMLIDLHSDLAAEKIDLYFAHVKDPVWDAMRRGGLEAALGCDHFFESVADAVKAFTDRTRTVPR